MNGFVGMNKASELHNGLARCLPPSAAAPAPRLPAAFSHGLSLAACFRSREEVAEVYNTPMLELIYNAASVHRMYNDPSMVRAELPSCPRLAASSPCISLI